MKKADTERFIQWKLAKALSGPKNQEPPRTSHPELSGLQPLKWFNKFHEVGVAINNKGNEGTGNIDILARRKGGRESEFVVFEVKRGGVNAVEKTFTQALRYAIALYIEANDPNLDGQNEDNDREKKRKENRGFYRKAFGCNGDSILKFSAVIVMEDTPRIRAEVSRVLAECKIAADDPELFIEPRYVGALLFTKTKVGDVEKYQWKWHPEGWDPSKNIPHK